MVSPLVATTPAQPATDGGHARRGHTIGGGQAHCYAFPSKTDNTTLNDIVTNMVPIYRRDASVLFDWGPTYLYV